ncbi:hypothetical protein [Streptomyces sp. NPDC020362]|uniref:hypothetical protein n=1 Tax=unclassified Streptomyces TaxID=2593676 RepID=UPI0034011288
MTDTATALDAAFVPDVIGKLVHCLAPAKRDVTSTTKFISDLAYHSLAMAELGYIVEDLFELDALPYEQTMGLETVQDIVDLIQKHLQAGEATMPTAEQVRLALAPHGGDWPLAA